MNNRSRLRTALLTASALLMLFGALGEMLVMIPDLHGDLTEIGVRPTVLGGTVVRFYFGLMAMFGFTLITAAAAIQSMRGMALARTPLTVTAIIYVIFGLMSFSGSHNPHHLGVVAMGVLLAAALVVPPRV